MIRPADLIGPPARPALDGFSTAVYGLVLPETRAAVARLWAERPERLYEAPYEDGQDLAHIVFLDTWQRWVAPSVPGLAGYSHRYVTVFAGEYEGYAAYARSAGVPVVVHSRDAWRDAAFASDAVHRWYISQPSAIDGNAWPEFPDFLRAMRERGTQVAVDLAYVGATPGLPTIDVSPPNVPYVFFSLSKVFGVFYHRIGGVLTRSPMLGLEGNTWFKNIFSLYLGTSLIDETPSPTWRTPEFQGSHVPGGYVYGWIERLAEYPRFVGELTDPRIERAHFSPWWNVLGRRTYENAAIHDLFYLHEISHMAMLVYEDTMSREAWAAKMADNEMLASLESETLVYLAMPSLRAKSFEQQIWADRFLGEEPYGGGMRDAAIRAAHRSFMLMERYRARRVPDDDLERRIAAFQHENEAWARIWRANYAAVERAMCTFRQKGTVNRLAAAEWFREWHAGVAGAGQIPFREEAEQFAEVYWRSRT